MKKSNGEQEKLLESLIHHIPLGVLIVDEKRHVIFANEMGKELHKFLSPVAMDKTQTSLGSLSFEALFSRENRGKVWDAMMEEKGGGMRIHTVRVIPLTQMGYTMILIQDETQKRRREHRERQDERFASLATISGGIAHNFNNIIMGVNGYLELALRMMPADNPVREHIVRALKAMERAEDLTRQLLIISQNQLREGQTFDAARFLGEMTPLVEEILGPAISYRFLCNIGPTFIQMDPKNLKESLLHLAMNAFDAMPDGGEVTLTLDVISSDEEGAHLPPSLKKGNYLIMRFEDTGRGMTKEVLNRAFDPFFTTRSLAVKSGLGLSAVKGMILQAEGEIQCRSMPDRGTTMTIYLPMENASGNESAKAGMKNDTGESAGRISLLLVDDDPNVRASLGEILRLEGFDVTEASSPDEALQLCAEDHDGLNILITDMAMAEMSGLDLYDRLKERCSTLKAIFMSGFNEETLHNARNLPEGTFFLQKPFPPDDLVTKIREWAGGEA